MGLVAVDAEERFEPERIVDALNRGGVRYVIVGGLAAGTHGVVRATRDLDLVPDPERSNMDRLARVLSDLGGQHPVTDQLTAAGIRSTGEPEGAHPGRRGACPQPCARHA